ncbi:plasmid replication initiator TrfA [Lamprobacter modestohalophilus]|uniref:plasmid replication initiator TrfA n=1 Tax=Lamprobacter modestohalophilus TaxID=1064514 RepID=UPI002ADEBBFD|nr:plasmid replication initiator TrfA [Lamprobacter modestohalophilus]MEA1053169.1 plasmid replication initiator TrfA [Lamprobacter modestohalophilus]
MSMMKPVSGLVAKIEALQEQARLRSAREERDPTPDAVISNNVVKLPLWPEAVRAVPNSFLRSALFGAIRKGRRRYIDGERLAAIDGIEVHYTGQRLDQGDLDVWESLLHAVRDQNLGSQCQVTSYALLKLMGKADTGGNRATLHKRITRLRASAIEIKQGRYVYIGGLVDEAYKDEETQEWVIVLNPRLRALYGADQFTQIDWAVRHALNGQQLAQWLHGFYASHAKPFPVRIETLLKLAGSENENSRSAQQKLRKALNAVAEASTAHGAGFSYTIQGDLVHVEKKTSGVQRRHLAKKASKPIA